MSNPSNPPRKPAPASNKPAESRPETSLAPGGATQPGTAKPVGAETDGRVRIESRNRPVDALPLVYLAAFVVLGGALWYLWTNPSVPAPMVDAVAQGSAKLEAVQRQVAELSTRVKQLEERPAPQPATASAAPAADLAPITERLAALEQRPAPAGNADRLDGLDERLATLEKRPHAADQSSVQSLDKRLATIEQRPPAAGQAAMKDAADRLAALEKRPDAAEASALQALTDRVSTIEGRPAPPSNADTGQLATRMDGIATRQDALAARQQADVTALTNKERVDIAAVNGRVDSLDGRLSAAESQAGRFQDVANRQDGLMNTLSERAGQLARIQAAEVALDLGQKLVPMPNAPPALTRYVDQAAPTEWQLRQSYTAAAEAARRASQPALTEDKPFATRLWNRAQQVVTIRQGDRVLLGDPVSGVLERARAALDAGDLSAAVAALDGLAGPAAKAMADWRARAQGLVDARAALSEMAKQAARG